MWNFQDTFETSMWSFMSAFSNCITVPLKLGSSTSQNIRKPFFRKHTKLFQGKILRLESKRALGSPVYYCLTQGIAKIVFNTRILGKSVSIAESYRRISPVKDKVLL